MSRALLMLIGLALVSLALAAGAAPAAAPPGPVASTGGATAVTFSTAVLHGSVNPRGQATNYTFQFGLTRRYGSQTPLSPAGNATTGAAVSQSVSGLQALKTYHYRIVALGVAGTSLGADRTFSTPPIPLSVAIAGAPNPVIFGNPFVLEGALSGTGSGGHLVTLQANPFPYTSGFQPVGNAQLTSATGAFSFPFVGLLQNIQLRVATVGKPSVSSPVILEGVAVKFAIHARSTRRQGVRAPLRHRGAGEGRRARRLPALKPGHRSVNVAGTIVKVGTATVSSFPRDPCAPWPLQGPRKASTTARTFPPTALR